MIKQLKKFTVNLIAGANLATVAVMLLAGYVGCLNPAAFPLLSCLSLLFPVFLLLNLAFLFFWMIFKWRNVWIPIAGYLLAYFPVSAYMPLHGEQKVPEGSIKFISFNVCSYTGADGSVDNFDSIAAYLESEQPDIVCLQEDDDSWSRHTFDRFREFLPYNDTTELVKTYGSYNCLGIHSRYPILRKERIAYPSRANGSVAYYLLRGKDTLLVINNHFEFTHLSRTDRAAYRKILKTGGNRDTIAVHSRNMISKLAYASALRTVGVDAVRRYVDDHRQYPTIVCGDFNDTPVSYACRQFSEVMTDAYVASGRGIGLSYNRKGFWVRIDHLFCSSDFTPYNCRVDSKTELSDHYPLVCWLKFQRNTQKVKENSQ